MKKKGADMVYEPVIWMVILLVVSGVVIYFFAIKLGPDGKITNYVKIVIPDFMTKKEPAEGLAILGIDLADDNALKYYDGSKWRSIDDKIFKIDRKEINKENFQNALIKFYFDTPRKGMNYIITDDFKKIGHPRTFYQSGGVSKPYMPLIISLAESFFVGDKDFNASFLNILDKKAYTDTKSKKVYSKAMAYSNYFPHIINWTDQILENGEYEKFVELSYKRNDGDVTNRYSVKRIDRMVFVDLNTVADREEKYQKQEPEVRDLEFLEENKFEYARISFNINSLDSITWSEEWDLSVRHAEIFDLTEAESRDFYLGLKKITEELAEKRGFLVFGNRATGVNIIFFKDAEFSLNNKLPEGILNDKGEVIDKEGFVELIVLEYNKGFLKNG